MSLLSFIALEKKTTSGYYLDNLTGVRALAVLWVLIFHIWGIAQGPNVGIHIPFFSSEIGLTRMFKMGEWGVDIFFVLSGFLLSLPLMKERKTPLPFWESTKDFYRRRALRLLPAFYFFIFIVLCMLFLGFGKLPKAKEILQQVTLVIPWFQNPPLRGVLWSLPVEATFYVFLPFLILLATRTSQFTAVFLGLALLTIAFRVFIINTPFIADKGTFLYSFFGRMDQFSFGVLAAYLCIKNPPSARRGTWILIAALLGTMLFINFIGKRGNMYANRDHVYYFYQTVIGLLAALLIYGAASPSRFANAIFGNRPMLFVGTISYSIYLWHTVVLDVFCTLPIYQKMLPADRLYLTSLATVPIIFLLSFFSYLFVERPFLSIRHDAAHQQQSFVGRNPVWFLIMMALALVLFTAYLQKITRMV